MCFFPRFSNFSFLPPFAGASVSGHPSVLPPLLSFLVLLSRRHNLAAVTLTSSGKYVVISMTTEQCAFPQSSNKKVFLRRSISDTVVMSWRLRPPILAALLLLLLASLQATDSQEVRNIASRKTLQTCPTEAFHLSEIQQRRLWLPFKLGIITRRLHFSQAEESPRSRLSEQGTGSPCYMEDNQGNEDLKRPQVRTS